MKKKAQLLELLNTATEELGRVRDTTAALDKISTLIVPAFATWFSIDLVVNGKLEELVLAHEDPQMVEWARKYRAAYPVDMNDDSLRSKVIRTGIPSCIPVITDKMIRDSVTNPEQLELIQKINLQSLIIVAIFIKEKIAGIINFVSSVAGMHYDEAHVNFAKNFANHVGLALENTRLNEAAAREIEYRKKVEWDLGRTQAQLQSALSSGLVGTWVRDLRKNLLFADESLSAEAEVLHRVALSQVFTNNAEKLKMDSIVVEIIENIFGKEAISESKVNCVQVLKKIILLQ